MIDVMQAVQIAKSKASEILDVPSSVEEIERGDYKGRDIWSITLGIPRDISKVPALAGFSVDPLKYKRFLIDTETGELIAMTLRETAAR